MADDVEELRKQVAYYRRRLDAQAGELVKADYKISSLHHEVLQKRQGFSLLTALQETTAPLVEPIDIILATVSSLNAHLGMDRTILLTRENGRTTPRSWYGVPSERDGLLRDAELDLSAVDDGALVVTKATERIPSLKTIDAVTGLQTYLCIPLTLDDFPPAFILTGRVKEVRPLYPPIDDGDVETVRALRRFIEARLREVRIGALQEADRVKTEFFANISHEFRTPITLTMGPLQGLLDGRHGQLTASQNGLVSVMLRNQTRLLNLVNQVLDIAKIESGNFKLSLVAYPDLNERIGQVGEQFQALADSRSVTLKMSLDPAVASADVCVDVERFDELLFNLLSNAFKFTAQGSVTVSTQLEADTFRLSVSDTGIGIREDQVPHVFERFRQADGSETAEFAGTGLGLALVEQVASLHGGSVSVQSEYGRGTTFAVELPVGIDAHDPSLIVEPSPARLRGPSSVPGLPAAGHSPADPVPQKLRGRPTVLYADDNADLRAYVRALLEPHYNVFLAPDGAEAFELALRIEPDLILSDLMMPRRTGVEFCRDVRADARLADTPFVLLTAAATQDSKLQGLEHGADDYLTKPFSERELLARVRNLLELRAHHTSIQQDLAAARRVQQALLPSNPIDMHGLRVEVLHEPSAALSGDCFDVLDCGGRVLGYVADVESHGTASAQVTYVVRQIVREVALRCPDASLREIAAQTRRRYADVGLSRAASLQMFTFDPSTHGFEFLRANAPPALCFGADVDLLAPPPGPPLSAAVAPAPFETQSCGLGPTGSVFVFSDGAYEFESSRRPEFGMRRLRAVLAQHGGDAAWVRLVREALGDACDADSFEDDVTVLRISWTPESR